jgi:hypothetical protein
MPPISKKNPEYIQGARSVCRSRMLTPKAKSQQGRRLLSSSQALHFPARTQHDTSTLPITEARNVDSIQYAPTICDSQILTNNPKFQHQCTPYPARRALLDHHSSTRPQHTLLVPRNQQGAGTYFTCLYELSEPLCVEVRDLDQDPTLIITRRALQSTLKGS